MKLRGLARLLPLAALLGSAADQAGLRAAIAAKPDADPSVPRWRTGRWKTHQTRGAFGRSRASRGLPGKASTLGPKRP